MTLATLADTCATRLRDPNHEVVSCATWYTYLNLAWKRVQQSSEQWPWNQDYDEITVTVAANTRQGCLDENGEVLSVRYVHDDTNDRVLVQATGNGGRSRYRTGSPNTPGAPEEYRIKGNEIELFPCPTADTSLSIGVNKWSGADLTYNQSPPIPAAFHTVLINGALALFHFDDANPSAAAKADEAFATDLANLRGAFLGGQDEKYPLLPDGF